MVTLSPFKSTDGTVFVGRKRSKIIAIDWQTGQPSRQYDPEAEDYLSRFQHPSTLTNENLVFFGRTEYTVSIFERDKLRLPRYELRNKILILIDLCSWKVTYIEYVPVMLPSLFSSQMGSIGNDHIVATVNGQVKKFDGDNST